MTLESKAELRIRLLAERRAIPPERRVEWSIAVARRVAALPAFAAAQTIALYAPIGAEVDTAEIRRLALGAGKRLAWPRLSPGRRALSFAGCREEELRPGPHGTWEPPADAPELAPRQIGLACVPGLAFDEELRRLGRGGGFYDATLPSLAGRALCVGLAFECQILPALPAEPHDARVDRVATERRLLGAAGGDGD